MFRMAERGASSRTALKPLGPSARIDAATTHAAGQSERVAAIRAALRRMLDDDAQAEQIARAFRGLLKR
jgi:hypothetical protein